MASDKPDSENRWLNTRSVQGDDYDAVYKERSAAGENVHGEADFVETFKPASVLDAGCGTGRVGIELARRGVDVVGVDIDPNMLATARKNAPQIEWHEDDLAIVSLNRQFDAIVMAGNVMIFLTPGTEGAVLKNMVRHLATGGFLIAGFHLGMGYLQIDEYDRLAKAAGLTLVERWSTWHRDRWDGYSNYAVSVHGK